MIKHVSVLQMHLEQIKQAITSNFKGKKQCVANVLFCGEEMLLLKRSNLDDFHPWTWCCPGGGIDAGEFPLQAVKRETTEEIGLQPNEYEVTGYWCCELPDVVIHYYTSYLKDPSVKNFIRLDNKEHVMARWCKQELWITMDLILQLKDHLIKIIDHGR